MIGQLGKYRVDGILGQGAMGIVYKAWDPGIARAVALKTIRTELFTDAQQADLVSRFRNEAQAAGRLQHPNIVSVYDYFEDAATACIAMEFIEGTPLDALLVPGRPTPLARVAAWMGDLLAGLAYAHARGVVHRDIKPANLLVTAQGPMKITDFGIARIESSTLTHAGALVGTPSYMSPEQFRGEPADGRADVFSSGIVLYQLLTGARPFTGAAAAVMQQILNDQPPAPSSTLPALGTRFDSVVATAMAKAPAARFASARDFDASLRAALGSDPDATQLAAPDAVMSEALDARESGSESTAGTLTPWKVEALPEVEALLARQIGPMARFLLKQVAARADGVDQLGELLLPHIPSDGGRLQFEQGLALLKKKLLASGTGAGMDSKSSWTGASAPAAGTTETTPFDDAWADATTVKLVALIGPIARVVAKRAMKETRDKAAFLQLLASHIDNQALRARFLREASAS